MNKDNLHLLLRTIKSRSYDPDGADYTLIEQLFTNSPTYFSQRFIHAWRDGDLNAAKELQAYLLPKAHLNGLYQTSDNTAICRIVYIDAYNYVFYGEGESDSMSRAWLIAILKVYIQNNEV